MLNLTSMSQFSGVLINSIKKKYDYLYFFILAIASFFFIIRFTPFLDKLFFVKAGNIHEHFIIPLIIIGAFIILSSMILFIGDNLIYNRNFFTTYFLFTVAAIIVIIVFGKLTYNIYIDEMRDVIVSNYISENSLTSYVNADSGADLGTAQESILWAQRLHPPGHYIPAIFLPDNGYSVILYRLLYVLPLIVFFIILFLGANKFNKKSETFAIMAFTFMAFTFSLSFIRNYTFIRFGNELFPYIFVSGILITVYYIVSIHKRFDPKYVALCMLLSVGAVWSKFTGLAMLGALAGCLFLAWLIHRQACLWQAAIVVALSVVSASVLYLVSFYGTPMLDAQATTYLQRVADVLDPAAAQGLDVFQRQTPLMFLIKLPVTWGLPLFMGLTLWFLWAMRRRFVLRPEETVAVLLILVGLAIVGVVFPRAQYTAPLMLAPVYLATLAVLSIFERIQVIQFMVLVLLFSITEIVLRGTAGDSLMALP